MADVKICDRCGKTIAVNMAQSFGFGAWKYSIFDHSASKVTRHDYDLCVECGDKFTRFLNGVELECERPDNALVSAGV